MKFEPDGKMSKRKRQDPSDNSSDSSSESHNEEDECNEFLVKGLKTKLNDQPDEIMDHIFSFLASAEDDDTVDLSLSMVSHKFRKAWLKTFGGVLHQCQSIIQQHVHRRAPKKLKVLEQLKSSAEGMLNTVFQARIKELEREKKERQNVKSINNLILKCKEKDVKRAERLMPILNRITKFRVKYDYSDETLQTEAKIKLKFDDKHYYNLVVTHSEYDGTDDEYSGWFSSNFWKKVKISREDMLWLVQIVIVLSLTFFYC